MEKECPLFCIVTDYWENDSRHSTFSEDPIFETKSEAEINEEIEKIIKLFPRENKTENKDETAE